MQYTFNTFSYSHRTLSHNDKQRTQYKTFSCDIFINDMAKCPPHCNECQKNIFPNYERNQLVGYTMRDIRYKWNEGPNSVGVSSEVSLPQFKVLGHRQRAMEISLTTGTCRRSPIFKQLFFFFLFSNNFCNVFHSIFHTNFFLNPF